MPRARRILGFVAKGIALLVLGALALVTVVLLSLDTAPARAFAASRVNALLGNLFRGHVVIEHIGHLGIGGVAGIRVHVTDAEGRRLLFADGVHARLHTVKLLRSLVSSGPLVVEIDDAGVAFADVSLDTDQNGALRLSTAFAPKHEAAPEPGPSKPGRGMRFTIGDAVLARGWVHGATGGIPIDADVVDGRAAFGVTPEAMTISLRQSRISTRGMPVGADVNGTATLSAAFPTAGDTDLHGTFSGEIGRLATMAAAKLHGSDVDAWLRSERRPGTEPTLGGAGVVPDGFAMSVVAFGPLSKIAVHTHAAAAPSAVDFEGTASVSPEVSVRGTLRVEHVDLRQFIPGAPPSDLGLVGTGSLALANGEPTGKFTLETRPGRLDWYPVPHVSAVGTLEAGAVNAEVLAEQRGARARIVARLEPSVPGPVLDVDAAAHVDDLERATRGIVEGSADLFANGAVDLGRSRVRGRLTVAARDVSRAPLGVVRTSVSGAVTGDLANPEIDAVVFAEGVRVGSRRFRSVSARMQGAMMRPSVEASLEGESRAPSVVARGDLSLASGVVVRNFTALAERDSVNALLGASSVALVGSRIRVDRAVVLGLGEPLHADVDLAPHRVSLRAETTRVDIVRAARVAGLDPKRVRGEASADINVHATERSATGHVALDLRKAAFGEETCTEGHFQAQLEDSRMSLRARGECGGGRLDLRSDDVALEGPMLRPETWVNARGVVDLSTDIDLERVHALVPASHLPLEDLRGTAHVNLRIDRSSSTETPTVALSVRTQGLHLAESGRELEPADSIAVQAPSPWRASDMDVDLDATLDPGADRTAVRAALRDKAGPIVKVSFDSKAIPLSVMAHPEDMKPFFERTPSRVVVSVPRRRFRDLPVPFARPAAQGTVELTAGATGTLLDPELEAVLSVEGFSARQRQREAPFDARLSAHHANGEGTAEIAVTSAGQPVATADLRGHVSVVDILQGRRSRFDASAHASFHALPLESVQALAAERVSGRLSGDVAASFGSDIPPSVQARLEASSVSVGRHHDNRVRINIDADRSTVRADARVEQLDGFAALEANVPVPASVAGRFGGPPPVERSGNVTLSARNFRLALLRPALEGVVSRLDGRLNGDMTLTASEGGRSTAMSGALALSEGKAEVTSLGQEFNSVFANVTFDRDGGIAVKDFRAEGTTGKMNGSASAHVSGYTLDRAEVTMAVPKGDPIPVTVSGQVLADASGKFHATLTRKSPSAPPEVDVDVSRAVVRLSEQSTHGLQSLEPADRVRVGVMRAPGHFELLRGGPIVVAKTTPTEGPTIKIRAKDIEVRRGTDMRVRLEGEPVVKTGPDEGVYGTITLREGFLYVQGKKFEIEKGTVTFNGEADNPEVVVTAGWTAPEQSRVYAEFVGPLKSGKLTLRSDPPHTKSEILSLILFGTTTGNAAPASGGSSPPGSAAASTAAGLGGGIATQGLNRALDDLTGLDVTTRVDTSESANPRPELEVRIARDVTVSIAHVLGVPPPGTNPDRNLATLGFRVHHDWTLEATFGDLGSSFLDLVWQYRY